VLEGTLHFEAAVQCDTVDGHASSEHSLPVSEVEEAGWLVAVAGEHTPSLPPLLYLDSLPVERRGLDKVAFLDRAGIHSQAPVHPRMRHAASRNIGLASGYADDNWSASHALGMIAICGLLQNNNIRRRCINISICSHTLQTAVSQARLSQEEERGLTCEMEWQKSRG
jgi:hypothetical protein